VQKNPTTRALLAALLLALTGCNQLDNCPDALDPITVQPAPAKDEYPGSTDLEALVYESKPWEGPLDAFPASTTMRFVHDLGVRPTVVVSYVSYTPTGTNDGDGGDVTENAGNQGRILCVDAHEIVIENDTCEEDFYIRVVAVATGHESKARKCQKEFDRR
jgi:hypothetical protein